MHRIYLIVPAAMSLLGLLQMPYGYYQLLKLVVTLAAGLIASSAWQRQSHVFAIAFAITALIYNPVIPLHLGRPVWQWVNIATALFFLLAMCIMERRERQARAARLAVTPAS